MPPLFSPRRSSTANNGLYKAEVIHKNGPWKGLDDVQRATLTWVEWFNKWRLLQPSAMCHRLNMKCCIIKPSQAKQHDSN